MNVNILVSTEGLEYQDWLAARRQGIGGSDCSAISGLNKYRSPMEVWLDKTGQIEPTQAGEAAYWGTQMEPIVRDEFMTRTGLKVKQIKAILQYPRYPFMLANIDGLVVDSDRGEGIFEAKTASAYRASEWEAGIPDEYALQVQHYMAVTGLSFAYVAVLIGGNQFTWRLIERDEAVIELLVQLENRFWRLVETRIAPDIDGSSASTELLNRLYPVGKSKAAIDLPADATQWIREYEKAQDEEKQAATRKDKAINLLKQALGESEIGVAEGRTVSWKTVTTERLDSKAFKTECPDLFQKYAKSSTSRRFGIK